MVGMQRFSIVIGAFKLPRLTARRLSKEFSSIEIEIVNRTLVKTHRTRIIRYLLPALFTRPDRYIDT